MKHLSHNILVSTRQMFLYLLVGAGATLVEWSIFYLFAKQWEVPYLIATPIAYMVATLANWALGRWLLFRATKSLKKELAKIYLTSLVGLVLNLIIMWAAIDGLGLDSMLSKIIATGIVFFWNFLIRKFIIYKI